MGGFRTGAPNPAGPHCGLRAVLLGLGLVAGAALPAAAERALSIRVLVQEGAEPVRLVAGKRSISVSSSGAALVAGGRAVGAVYRPSGKGPFGVAGRRLRGRVEFQAGEGGHMRVINHVPLEDYVAGTLGREIYTSWSPETLKAQAVVTRTYALYKRRRRADAAWDVRADTSDQVYGGLDAETPAVRAAVRATAGQALTWGGEPILAAFHSAAGGRTATAEEVWGRPVPYLVSVPVQNEEDSPDTYWRARVSGTTLGRALAPHGIRIGPVREIRVVERTTSGRVRRVRVRGEGGSGELEGRALRDVLGATVIRSTLFEVHEATGATGEFVFVGSGHGHGVGMSQWGAEAMARDGAGYREILETYYPGTRFAEASP